MVGGEKSVEIHRSELSNAVNERSEIRGVSSGIFDVDDEIENSRKRTKTL